MAAEPPRREREVVRERPAERETVVRDGGNPFGIVAAIVGVLLVLLLAWLLFFRGPADDGGTEFELDVPGEIDVDVDQGDGTTGGDDGGDAGTDLDVDAGTDADAGTDGS